MDFNSIPAGTSIPDDFNAIIEIPADASPVKYEADKGLNLFRVDRFLSTSMRYPANYGFVPSTLSRDGDPVDVLVVAPYPIQTGALVRCRPIGLMKMTDEAGEDAKVIAVPIDKICAASVGIEVLPDLGEALLSRIEHFFKHYKSLEPGKWVRFEGWGDIDAARKELLEAQAAFKPHA
ncbi:MULTISPECIES: inorganic diphosphatase [Pandoraea]|uniref:Inorganic pyrophosphatase n=1 Tax=Pandoraea pneumonica TaxID=2508299 RepID=A0A5E4RKG6_9BURK|nr:MULTISPECIES: inorganic diphosphatase [Pandoraea]AJF00194.1 inorganic pyrophosphatase [Pandoraea apista]AKH74355.1 inorganic pyrophosphatase [Pandoraea apista]AKI62905.1 inorganic pyrophosphatase [Pandoraea apista]VVD62509.1 inorganic pyrophosphatase [Pandoraea pneumonica]